MPLPREHSKEGAGPLRREVALKVPDTHGIDIPCRFWKCTDPKGTIVMLHGLQSHSGWFTESALKLAASGYNCYAFDRRGSGLSDRPKGHLDDYRELVDEVQSVVVYVKDSHPGVPVHLLSLCFGAKAVCAFIAERGGLVESAVFLSPGIFTKVNLSRWDQIRVLLGRKDSQGARIPTPLQDELFTDVEKYLEFIRNDNRGLRTATPGMYFQVFLLDRVVRNNWRKITVPVLFMLAGQDPIVDNRRTIEFFEKLPAAKKRLHSYAEALHSLLFSAAREQVIDDILQWLHAFSNG